MGEGDFLAGEGIVQEGYRLIEEYTFGWFRMKSKPYSCLLLVARV